MDRLRAYMYILVSAARDPVRSAPLLNGTTNTSFVSDWRLSSLVLVLVFLHESDEQREHAVAPVAITHCTITTNPTNLTASSVYELSLYKLPLYDDIGGRHRLSKGATSHRQSLRRPGTISSYFRD